VPTNHSKACWRQHTFPTCWRDRGRSGHGHDTHDSIIKSVIKINYINSARMKLFMQTIQ